MEIVISSYPLLNAKENENGTGIQTSSSKF